MLYIHKGTKLRTRIWSLLLCLCMVLSCLPVTVSAETDGGEDDQPPNQDENGTYLIATASHLYWFAKHVNDGIANANAKLTADIIVNDSLLTGGNLPADTSALKQWTPIGNSSTAYKGTFDGDGHTISGLYYSGSDQYVGLFGYIGDGATIQNVGVIDSCFQVSGSSAYLGGIVGYAKAYANAYANAYAEPNPITISGCSSAALLASTVDSAYVGGVVGYVYSNGESVTIQNCSNTGDITATSASSYGSIDCGGMAGYVISYSGSVTIQNCMSTGDITATTTSSYYSSYCGGVAGYVSAYGGQAEVTLSNCYYTTEEACGGTYAGTTVVTTVNLEKKTAEQFASGEVAYLLNGSKSDESVVWKQTLSGSEKMSVPGFSGRIVNYDAATNTYSNAAHVSVTITWEAMEFTYTDGDSKYNSATHETTVGDGSWGEDKKKITVTNHSDIALTATFHFAAGEGVTTTGTFYEYRYIEGPVAAYYLHVPLETDEQKIDLAAGGTTATSGDIYFDVSGDAISENTKLGAITVKISKDENVAKTEDALKEKPEAVKTTGGTYTINGAKKTPTAADTDIVLWTE